MTASAPRYALLSLSDKRGLLPLAEELLRAGLTLLSTGGTAQLLLDHGLPVTAISELTKTPPLLDGRVKTLHPTIHAGILARRDDPTHLDTLREHGIPLIDVVAVNLYPFEATAQRVDASLDDTLEQIDIGGVTLLRAAAKNFTDVLVLVDPDDYAEIGAALACGEEVSRARRRTLAQRAFVHTARYDAAIAAYFTGEDAADGDALAPLPEVFTVVPGAPVHLRYGENPHQAAALYPVAGAAPLGGCVQLHGKALSYNNLIDLDAALELLRELSAMASCVIVKHTNPCGCASGDTLQVAFEAALASDPISAFGGIVALNRPVDEALAHVLGQTFFEIIAAPGFSEAASAVLQRKSALRLIETPAQLPWPRVMLRATSLGLLAQRSDPPIVGDLTEAEVVTRRAPTQEELEALSFAWRVVKHVKSNAIVLASARATVGIGAGQMSRVEAVQLAVMRARGVDLSQAVLASDAFFPFADGPLLAIEAGVRAIVQPGGSKRDQEVIEACDAHGVAMIFAGARHFRH